ncbi:hypothetical protein JXB12_08265 [candidate division KSB1 bacterium]|nr:hypothetical protein [candidate division KSB1 bacterium]
MTDRKRFASGYMGKVLKVDLTTREFRTEDLDTTLAEIFFGGRGLGVAYLCKHFIELESEGKYSNAFREVDPLSPDNVIVISTSPATGTRMPTSGRIHMNFKSPLTGAYGSSNAGGRWGVDFKKTGHDVVIITGKSESPVYLIIDSTGVEFIDANETRELDSIVTRRFLKDQYSDRLQVLTIGDGGKNLCRFAAVMSDTGKALGRGGGGAVWGSKNLFAVGVIADPDIKIEIHNPDAFDSKNKNGAMYTVKMKLDMGKFTKKEDLFGILSSMGSLGILGMVHNYHQLIHHNMRDTEHRMEDIEQINGEALRYHYQNTTSDAKRIKVKKSACYNCPIICKRETAIVDENDHVIKTGEGPEFESVTLLGANLSIYNLVTITEANYLANHYGLDTISLGSTIAALFELFTIIVNKGDDLNLLEKKFLDDINDFVEEYGEPGFGRGDLLIPLITSIGRSEGIGNLLKLGSYRFCKRYGYERLSMSVKKLELPAYDPRTSFSQALCYEMNNRGGCHLEGGYTAPHAYCAGYAEWPAHRTEGTPLISKNATQLNVSLDIIGACAYGSFSLGLDEYAELVNAVTGHDYSSGNLKELAVRTVTLERMFNRLCGLTCDNDWLPDRFYTEKIMTRDGEFVCDRNDFLKMHEEYYKSFGWDEHGIPTRVTLERLNIDEIIPGFNERVE